MHYVRHGAPLVLLHGWPEFWYAWRKNAGPLAEAFDVVPDLRGHELVDGEIASLTMSSCPPRGRGTSFITRG